VRPGRHGTTVVIGTAPPGRPVGRARVGHVSPASAQRQQRCCGRGGRRMACCC